MEDNIYEELFALETLEEDNLTSITEYCDKESLAMDLIHYLLDEKDETTDTIKVVKIIRCVDKIEEDIYETLKVLKINKGE